MAASPLHHGGWVHALTESQQVGWNAFRLSGDILHFAGMCLGLATVWGSRSVEGFSRKTQVLYQAVYITRYIDIFIEMQGAYLMFFKVTFNLITALMLAAFAQMQDSYEPSYDSCNILAMGTVAWVSAMLTTASEGMRKELWAFSEFLEPFALIPQYVMCYRAPRIRPAAVVYVLCVGGYRTLYVCNWIYKRSVWHGQYHDYVSWSGGLLECVLFFDFVWRISQRREVIGAIGASNLGRVLLHADDTAGRFSEKIEMSTLGRRIPFGLTGSGLEDKERVKRQWDVSDKLVDEESSQLLTLSGADDGMDTF